MFMIPVYISSVCFFFNYFKKHKHMCISIQSFFKNHTASLLTFKPIKMFLLALALHLLIQAHVQILILILPLKTILFPLFLYSNGRTHTYIHTQWLRFFKFCLQHDVEIIPCQFVLIFLFFIVMEYSTVYLLHWPLMNGF